MTTLTSNIQSASANAMLSLSFSQLISRKKLSTQSYSSYAPALKHASRKSLVKLFSMDWDMNMNELEFE